MAAADGPKPSFLLMEEFFASGDDRFLPTLRALYDPKKLAAFADRWKKDFRPWAREQIFAYLDQPLSRPGHNPLVKRLFKHFEAANDDEMMGAFLVAFDRTVRRVRKRKYRYDWQTRTTWEEERLVTPRNTITPAQAQYYAKYYVEDPAKPKVIFSYHTRYYLRRRAWRYFRKVGFRRAKDYTPAVAAALARYRDADLAKGENILDSWGLMHACFRRHPALEFRSSTVELKPNRGLAELTRSPQFPELWKRPEASRVLLALVTAAQSRLARVWAMQLLRAEHKEHLTGISVEDLLRLLDHADEEVQQFGAELLEGAYGLEKMPVASWLRLLQTKNVTALATIAQVMLRHVSAQRLTLEQCVELAAAQPVPVARIGLQFLQTKPIKTPADRQTVAGLSRAKSAGVGRELALWALGVLGDAKVYDVDLVSRFFDSLLKEMREGAWEWLLSPAGTRGYDDPALWARLIETPYEDGRLRLVEVLAKRAKLPGTGPADLAPVWTAVLLGVHRGGRQKLTALRQISDAVRNHAEQAELLLPALSAAIRSVRAPEARGGLAAVVAAVDASPALEPAVRKYLPELNLTPEGAAV